jgi:hypothetical protein
VAEGVKMKLILIFIFFLEIILIHGEEKKMELIKIKVRIGSSEYISYVQMSNVEEFKNFKILKEM